MINFTTGSAHFKSAFISLRTKSHGIPIWGLQLGLQFNFLTVAEEHGRYDPTRKRYGRFFPKIVIFHTRISALQVGLFLSEQNATGFQTKACRRRFGLPNCKFSARTTWALGSSARFFPRLFFQSSQKNKNITGQKITHLHCTYTPAPSLVLSLNFLKH